MNAVAQIRKALAAAAGAGVAVIAAATARGQITQSDWALAIGSAIVAGVLVFFVPNAAPAPAAAKP